MLFRSTFYCRVQALARGGAARRFYAGRAFVRVTDKKLTGATYVHVSFSAPAAAPAQLVERLSPRVGTEIQLKPADEVGWSAEGMEAELMAYLAVRSSRALPITFPGTTGVAAPLVGGTIFRSAA